MPVSWLILTLALVLGGTLLVRAILRARPGDIVRAGAWTLGGLTVGLVVFLAASGRLAGLISMAAVLVPVVGTLYRYWQRLQPPGNPRTGQRSEVETATLSMTLDHDSGTIDGVIRAGPLAGRALNSLERAEALWLYREVVRLDPSSVALLETWLERAHPGWRAEAGAERVDAPGPTAADDGPMTPAQALAVLGLTPGASAEQIRDAHRRLMATVHPDRGGSSYLAAKVNRARDVLLEQ